MYFPIYQNVFVQTTIVFVYITKMYFLNIDINIFLLDMARHVDEYANFCLRNLVTSQPQINFPKRIVKLRNFVTL